MRPVDNGRIEGPMSSLLERTTQGISMGSFCDETSFFYSNPILGISCYARVLFVRDNTKDCHCVHGYLLHRVLSLPPSFFSLRPLRLSPLSSKTFSRKITKHSYNRYSVVCTYRYRIYSLERGNKGDRF